MGNDISQLAQQVRIEQWMQIIDDRIQSGLTINDYCNLHNISRNQYFYWLRRVRKNAIQQSPQFAELPAPAEPCASINDELSNSAFIPTLAIRIGGAVIEVNDSTSSTLIQRVAEVLSNA